MAFRHREPASKRTEVLQCIQTTVRWDFVRVQSKAMAMFSTQAGDPNYARPHAEGVKQSDELMNPATRVPRKCLGVLEAKSCFTLADPWQKPSTGMWVAALFGRQKLRFTAFGP